MAEQEPQGSPSGGGGYGRNWLKYLLIYLVVGGAIYALIYFVFLGDGGYGS